MFLRFSAHKMVLKICIPSHHSATHISVPATLSKPRQKRSDRLRQKANLITRITIIVVEQYYCYNCYYCYYFTIVFLLLSMYIQFVNKYTIMAVTIVTIITPNGLSLRLSLPHYLDALKGPSMNKNISKSISHMVGLSTSWWWRIPQMASEKPLPLVNIQKAIENGHRNSGDFPMKKMVDLSSSQTVSSPGRVFHNHH